MISATTSATAVEVMRTRSRLPEVVISRTVPGQTLRGLPAGRSRWRETASGATIARAWEPSATGSATVTVPPVVSLSPSVVVVPGQALRPSMRATHGERGICG